MHIYGYSRSDLIVANEQAADVNSQELTHALKVLDDRSKDILQ